MISTFIQVLTSFQLVPPKVRRRRSLRHAAAIRTTCSTRRCRMRARVGLWRTQKDSYVEDLWKMWDFNSDGTISLEEYCRGCLANQEFIAFLGGHRTRIGACCGLLGTSD